MALLFLAASGSLTVHAESAYEAPHARLAQGGTVGQGLVEPDEEPVLSDLTESADPQIRRFGQSHITTDRSRSLLDVDLEPSAAEPELASDAFDSESQGSEFREFRHLNHVRLKLLERSQKRRLGYEEDTRYRQVREHLERLMQVFLVPQLEAVTGVLERVSALEEQLPGLEEEVRKSKSLPKK